MMSSNGNIFCVLVICAGNSPVPGEFPAQRPVTRSFGVFFDLRLYQRLSKQSWGWWFETLPRPLWRHCIDSWKPHHSMTSNWSTCILSVTRIYACLAFCIIIRHRKKYLSDDREYCFLWQIGSRHQLTVYGWCPASVFVGCSRSFQIWKIHSSSHSTFIFATICYRIHMHDAIIWVHFANALVDNRHLQCHTELILSDIFHKMLTNYTNTYAFMYYQLLS